MTFAQLFVDFYFNLRSEVRACMAVVYVLIDSVAGSLAAEVRMRGIDVMVKCCLK